MKKASQPIPFYWVIASVLAVFTIVQQPGFNPAFAETIQENMVAIGKTEIPAGNNRAAASLQDDNDGIRVGPNPFTPNNNGFNDFVRFDFSGANAVTGYLVRIFDMNGKQVRSLAADGQSEIIWDGTDTGGSVLKPGIYLYLIERNSRVIRRGSITLAL